jgi:hypothetical protein
MTDAQTVITAFGDKLSDSAVFINTALWNNSESIGVITKDPLEIINISDGNHYKMQLTVKNTELLTGQYAQMTIKLDELQHDVTDTLRVYFQLEEGNGAEDGSKLFGYEKNKEITFSSGDASFTGTFHVDESVPYRYYVELTNIRAGQTKSLDLQVTYPNWTTSGGSMLVWLDNSEGTTSPTKVNQVIWKTQSNDYSVSETTSGTPAIKGDGTADSEIYVSNLIYKIQMKSTSVSDYGKNPAKEIAFHNALTLPDGFSWGTDILKNVQNGNWKVTSKTVSSNTVWTITTTLEEDGTAVTYTLATLSVPTAYSGNVSDIHPVVTADGIQIAWTQCNANLSKEIDLPAYQLTYGSQVILANEEYLEKAIDQNGGAAVTCNFTNTVTTTEYLLYGGQASEEGEATSSKAVAEATFSITKTSSTGSPRMGMGVKFYMNLTNSSVLPYTKLDTVTDELPNWYYIQPEDMDEMFAETDKGKNLTITIKNLTLYDSFAKETVKNAQGETVEITHPDYTSSAQKKEVKLQWAEDQSHLEMYVGGTLYTTIGEDCPYATIQDAFAVLPYMVFRDTTYACVWDQTGQNLYSGETRIFTIRATTKSSFMYLTADVEEALGSSYATTNTGYAYYDHDGNTKTYARYWSYIYRDFVLKKSVTFSNRDSISDTTEITPGDVLYYTNTVTPSYTAAYDALSVTAHSCFSCLWRKMQEMLPWRKQT